MSKPRSAFAVLAAVAVLLASACGGDESGAESTNGGATEEPSGGGGVLRISDPGNHGPLAYAKREGILEARLAEVGAKVEWGGNYPNSTASFDAIRAGELNTFGGNTTVTVGYLSGSDNAQVVALADPYDRDAPPSAGLFVDPDGDIATPADLAGKRIGVNIGGYGEYLLMLALEEAGVDPDSVTKVNLQADEAAAAFVGGSIDGFIAIVNAFQPAVSQGYKLLVSNRDVPDESVGVVAVTEDLLDDHPELVKEYVEVVEELYDQQREEPEEFQNVFRSEGPDALSGDQLEAAIEVARHTPSPHVPTDEDVARFQRVADAFFENGAISKPIDAASQVSNVDELVSGEATDTSTAGSGAGSTPARTAETVTSGS